MSGHKDLPVLRDPSTGYSCHQIPPLPENQDRIRAFKEYLIGRFTRYGYEGFSLEIDAYFDPFSIFFYVENDGGEILATAKMTWKSDHTRIPLEMGVRADGSRFSLEGNIPTFDVNSFAFTRLDALPLLYAGLGSTGSQRDTRRAFCLLDEENLRIKELYAMAGFRPSERFNERIYYPTYGKRVNGLFKPTWWTIMEMDHETILKHGRAAEKYVAVR